MGSVQDQKPIWFGCVVCKSIHKPMSITWANLVRHGSKLRCVMTVTTHYIVVRIKWDCLLGLTQIIHVLQQINYS